MPDHFNGLHEVEDGGALRQEIDDYYEYSASEVVALTRAELEAVIAGKVLVFEVKDEYAVVLRMRGDAGA